VAEEERGGACRSCKGGDMVYRGVNRDIWISTNVKV